MKLYKYTFNMSKAKVELQELEVKEKEKTYTVSNAGYRQRISKEDIGRVSGYGNNTVILIEKDFEKARTIYLACLQKKIIEKKDSLATYEKYYKDICGLEAV